MSVSVLNTDANLSAKTLLTGEGAHTIEGLYTFDRDPNAPFAVSSGSAAVSNLDADKLDGQEGSYYTNASNLASGLVPAAVLPGGQYKAQVYNNGTQALTNDTVTAVTFDTEEIDTGSFHSTASNTSRLTVPANAGGTYLVVGTVSFVANNTGHRQARLAVNGASTLFTTALPVSASEATVVQVVGVLALSAADYVELFAYQNSGGSLNIGHASTRLLQSELRLIRLI